MKMKKIPDITKNWTDQDFKLFITELDSFEIGSTFSAFTFFKNMSAQEQEIIASKINAPIGLEVHLREQLIEDITSTVLSFNPDELELLSLNELLEIAEKTNKINEQILEVLTIILAKTEAIECDGTEEIIE